MTVEQQFEVHGYFEQLGIRVGDRYKSLGTRTIPKPVDRPLGVAGERTYTFTAPFTLTAGHKQVLIKASQQRPVVAFGIANALCGRAK